MKKQSAKNKAALRKITKQRAAANAAIRAAAPQPQEAIKAYNVDTFRHDLIRWSAKLRVKRINGRKASILANRIPLGTIWAAIFALIPILSLAWDVFRLRATQEPVALLQDILTGTKVVAFAAFVWTPVASFFGGAVLFMWHLTVSCFFAILPVGADSLPPRKSALSQKGESHVTAKAKSPEPQRDPLRSLHRWGDFTQAEGFRAPAIASR